MIKMKYNVDYDGGKDKRTVKKENLKWISETWNLKYGIVNENRDVTKAKDSRFCNLINRVL